MKFFSSVIFIINLDFDLRIEKNFYISCERHYGHFGHFFEAYLITLKLEQKAEPKIARETLFLAIWLGKRSFGPERSISEIFW